MMMNMVMMMLLMNMEKIRFHQRCQTGGAKYTIHQIKSARPFITFDNNPIWWWKGTMQKTNNPDKGIKIVHYHRVCYSDHINVPEYHFSKSSKVNSPYLHITCRLPIFMAWIFMIIQITYVMFILGTNLK